ncbi:MAG TPA: carboxypeptidase regulatory-like domain-containing protein, partial [Longimicrobiales bacterium]|nr:carboxypeptidase regulatory-like domain-containing protein [Longimicrobiales bacterium]
MSVQRWTKHALGAFAALLLTMAPAAAQQGSITGVVRAETGDPIAGAQVSIVEPGAPEAAPTLATFTQSSGRFMIRQVPAGEWLVRVELIGYGTETSTVQVTEGAVASVEFIMSAEAIGLGSVVVTGVSGATIQAKVPFEVGQVQAEDLPVPAVSAGSAIQGKVAGAQVVQGSGRPGSSPSILLRGATSINASGRDQEPLYIVDGVIVGSGLTDINSMDIQSIEVVKGAAAASMYGSRAANGVVQITTKRGTGLPDNTIRYSVRSEWGISQLSETPDDLLAKNHPFEIVQENGQTLFVDDDTGEACAFLDCSRVASTGSNAWDTYYVNEWPNRYDQVADFFQDGNFTQQHFAAQGRSGATNFHVSYNHLNDAGILPGLEGFQRHNFRVNVDQSVLENVHVGASAFYSLSDNDQFPESQGNPMFALTRSRAGANLWTCDESRFEEGETVPANCRNRPEDLIIQTDPANTEADNPVYALSMREYRDQRSRFLGNGSVRWTPLEWFDLEGNVSYDRLNYQATDYYPKGFRTIDPSTFFNEGYLDRLMTTDEALNASATATFRADLADGIRNRTQFRYLYEQNDYAETFTSGYQMTVADIIAFGNLN